LELAGVALADLGERRDWPSSMLVEVVGSEGDPALVELDADGTPTEQAGFGEGGADASQRVTDDIAGSGVLGHDAPGELGEHLSGMAGTSRQVAPGALPLRGALRDRPDGERHLGPGWMTGLAGVVVVVMGGPRPGKRHLKNMGQ